MSTETPRADAAAAAVGAVDLFVLRRVRGDQFVHFGGSGRGAGWAGIVEVAAGESDALSASLATRSPTRLVHDGKDIVFGPYYASAAAFVPVTNDVVVVFGFEAAPEAASDEALAGRGDDGRRCGRRRHACEAARRRARGARGRSGGARGRDGRRRGGDAHARPRGRRDALVRARRRVSRGGRADRARRPWVDACGHGPTRSPRR